jgi:hypothetical protein
METSASFEARSAPSSYPTISFLGGAVVGWPALVSVQQPANVARIGYLATGSLESPEAGRALLDAFARLRSRSNFPSNRPSSSSSST